MIKREFYKTRKDGVNLYKTYSDEGYRIKQVETGSIYDEAIDIETTSYTYQETDEKIAVDDINAESVENLWKEVVIDGLK